MRHLNTTEKRILKTFFGSKMYKKQGAIRPSVILEESFIGPKFTTSLYMNSKKNEVIVSIKKEEKEKLDKLIFTVAFFLLIRDLEQEGMLTCIGDEDQVDGILGEYYMEGQNIRLPTEVKGYAFKYFQSLIFLSEDLKELVDDNFRDKEEIRYRETLFVAVAALITSILLGVWGIWN